MALARGSLGGTVVGICPAAGRPTTTAAVQLSALNKPAKSSGARGEAAAGKGQKETRKQEERGSLPLPCDFGFVCLDGRQDRERGRGQWLALPFRRVRRHRSKMFTSSPLNHLKRQTKRARRNRQGERVRGVRGEQRTLRAAGQPPCRRRRRTPTKMARLETASASFNSPVAVGVGGRRGRRRQVN